MCGIVGALVADNCVPILVDGLKKLEYRGYDSAGLAVQNDQTHSISRARNVGRVSALEESSKTIKAKLGIAHTRWATHGVPSERNAHPHISTSRGVEVSVVHNGIIENYEELKTHLQQKHYEFESETDTEVIAHLIHSFVLAGSSVLEAVQKSMQQLQGAFAIAVICNQERGTLISAKRGAPLLVGHGQNGLYVASDASALVSQTKFITYLQENDVVKITSEGVQVFDGLGVKVQREIIESELSADDVELGPYNHYMQKEMYEQPGAIAATLEMVTNTSAVKPELFGAKAHDILTKAEHILILACGTSYHAACVARYWLEGVSNIATSVEIASEYRYRDSVCPPNTLVITVSQSGETADTLAALEHAKTKNILSTLSICNVPESSLIRASTLRFLTRAGPEIGVASTKAFTTQLVAFFVLTMVTAKLRGVLDHEQESALLQQLRHLPAAMQNILSLEPQVRDIAKRFAQKKHALFLGRGVHYPIAQEGALKLKEVSYIHAEAYAAGELKHGPLALIDQDMPVVSVAPRDSLIEKLKSNLQEVRARGGELYIFADRDTKIESSEGVHVLKLLDHAGYLSPILHVLPLQLLAYHVALVKGTDVDKPRNLAKSVTVE